MNMLTLAAKNVTRNRLRIVLTAFGVAISVLAYLLFRTILWSYSLGVEIAAKDRLATRHKLSFILWLPRHYAEDIKAHVPEVTAITTMNWFGGKDPKDESNMFANWAVDHQTLLTVYPELILSDEAKQRWLSDPQAAIVGEAGARKMGLKEGDNFSLMSPIYQGTWEFHLAGIYKVNTIGYDTTQMYFHYDYLNNKIPERIRDNIGMLMMKIDDPRKSAEVATAIDRLFEDRDKQTVTMSERQFFNGFMAMFGAIMSALDIASYVLLAIMALILGNTLAMGVRERTNEYGVLKALGFETRHILAFIVGEGFLTGLAGGLLGLLLAFPVLSAMGRFISDSMLAAMLPAVSMQTSTIITGLAVAVAVGALAAVLPAWGASRLKVTDALRRTE